MANESARRPILSVQQIAEYYGVDPLTATNWIEQGKLPSQLLPDGTPGVPIDALNRFLTIHGMLTPREAATAMTILVVDDDPSIRKYLIQALARAWKDAKIEEATTGFEAGRKLLQLLPHVLILDLMLPGVDGFDVLAAVRSEPRLSRTIVIAITGYDTPEHRQKMLSGGAHAFFAKPFDPMEIVSGIAELLAARKG